MKDTIQEIREIASRIRRNSETSSGNAERIMYLCDQEPQGQVITNPVEDWTDKEYEELTVKIINKNVYGLDSEELTVLAMKLQEILTRPKEKELWVYWMDEWGFCVMFTDNPVNIRADNIYKTTNAQIKEIGVLVLDWQALVFGNRQSS